MNDRLTIAAMLMARDWPNITRDEAIAAIPELLEMADALLAAAGEQDIAADLKESDSIIVTLQEQLSAALEDNEAMRKNLAPIMEERLVYQARAEAADAKCADLERENAALRRRAEPLTADEALTIKVDTASDLATAWIMADKAIMDAKSRRSSDG